MMASDWQAGDRVGAYELSTRQGSGGMGVVWRATSASGEVVAVKLMHAHLADDAELIQRFHREFEVGRRFQHPNLVAMLDQGVIEGVPFLVMQLAQGKTIRRLIERGGPFREWEAVSITLQIASGVEALAAGGVTHRDLKSNNVVVDHQLRTTIIDFGIARVEGERTLAQAESFIGSAEYSSPEPYLGRKVTTRSDIYSMGIVFYEMLTGRVPFRSDRYTDTLRMHAELPVPRPSERAPLTSPEVDSLVVSMLQKNPGQRPPPAQVASTCRELLMLHGRVHAPSYTAGRPQPATPPPSLQPRPIPAGTRDATRRLLMVMSIVLAAVAATLGALVIGLAAQ